MQKPLNTIVIYTTAILMLSACNKKNAPDLKPTDKIHKVGLQKVSASLKNIDLRNRADWQLFIGSQAYSASIKDNSNLVGTPVKDSFHFEYQGNITDAPASTVFVYYSSSKYGNKFGPTFKESGPNFTPPNIFNQSSVEDLMKADLLIGKYNGSITSEISNLQLTHANALLEFNIDGLKNSDTVYVNDLKMAFRPYDEGNGQYKSIVTGNWIGIEKGSPNNLPPVLIEVRSSNRKVSTSLISVFYPIKSNTKYKFNGSIGADTLIIKDQSISVWDNEVFPFKN